MRSRRLWLGLLLGAVAAGSCDRGHEVQPAAFDAEELGNELAALDEALEGVRIVLLGENGHGVKQHTEAKVHLVEWLHREHDFDLVLFESGFFECGRAWQRLRDLGAEAALRSCLRYPFEHAELLPLFELSRRSVDSGEPLRFGGIDLQAQGFDSENRPEESFAWLAGPDSILARRIASSDSALFLVPRAGGLGERLYQYAYENEEPLRHDYRRAAALTDGHASWTFRLGEAWVDRLALRGEAEAEGTGEIPTAYFQLRDEWMARAVAAHTDSIGQPEKVIVWLHNDHARLGRFPAATGDSIRSTGNYLREWYGAEVLSVGLFFGRGEIADNARRVRAVAPLPPGSLESFLAVAPQSYVVLRNNRNPDVQRWARAQHPYLRMGLDTMRIWPGREFDVLMFTDSVSSPTYEFRGSP